MKEDVRLVGGTVTGFNALWMFNVKFKFSDTKIYYSNPPVIRYDTLGHRYTLMDKTNDFVFLKDEEGNVQTLDTSSITRTTKSGKIIIDPLHKKIQNAVVLLLKINIIIYIWRAVTRHFLLVKELTLKGYIKRLKSGITLR